METSTGQASDFGGRAGGQASINPLKFREPRTTDGVGIHDLIAGCPPLDANSLYCNLLQASHFATTCVVAESEADGALGGWVSGYIRPDRPDRLFIWQVAVAPQMRGRGLGGRMVREILSRDACQAVTGIETTVTSSNSASRAMFRRLAGELGAAFRESPCFEADKHFAGRSPAEFLLEIGPVRGGRSAA